MDREEFSLKATSLLRKAGLAQVPRAAVAGLLIAGIALVLIGIWHFWPRANADFTAPAASSSSNTGDSKNVADETASSMKIDVEGAVVRPGLYDLPADARVGDAVEAAGGLTEDAASGGINLAQKLADGEQVFVPSVEEQLNAEAAGPVAAQPNAQQGAADKININTASADELQQLNGVGPALSQRIVEHRQSKGRFASVEDLKNVSGIGDAKFASLKDKICV